MTGFSTDIMMEHSFVMGLGNNEFGLFDARMRRAGFGVMPKRYVGRYPKVLFDSGKRHVVVNACALNHYVIVNMARAMDWPFVSIFESDAFPMVNCRRELDVFFGLHGVPEDADEIVLGNLNFIREHSCGGARDCSLYDVHDGYGRIRRHLWGAHAVVLFRRGYDTWIDRYLRRETEINADWFNDLTPNCYACERSFFIQKKDDVQYRNLLFDVHNLKDFPDE